MKSILILMFLAMPALAEEGKAFQQKEESMFSSFETFSKDHTKIGYRKIGVGPGLILVEGAMGTTANYEELAQDLSSSFTVYIPDRRGRGLSAKPFDSTHSIQKDVEDIEALTKDTGASYLFGLSSGAVITLTSATKLDNIKKSLFMNHPFSWAAERFHSN